jgi:hypothetical protein
MNATRNRTRATRISARLWERSPDRASAGRAKRPVGMSGVRTLALLALLAAAPLGARGAEGTGEIYTWTDQAGVMHFSDAPPRPAAESTAELPLALDEDTPVPATLNELFPTSDAAGAPGAEAAPNARNADPGVATAPVPYRPGSGGLPLDTPQSAPPVPPGGPSGDALSVEELEALDPVWLRGDQSDATELYMDERGPFTIGAPIEDMRAPPEQRCAAARRDLEVLRDSWPVYRDQTGRLRYQWERDPYRGARRYLDADARKAALAAVRQTLTRECATPDDPGAQSAARAQLLQASLCEAERAELQAMESLGGDSPTQTLTDKRALTAKVCGDPPPDQG